ncbi:MAG: phosphohistidine phosphatase [Caulobacter sp.]|nr:phosphohistidine phosphatase [Caulobacter sp.]
MDRLIVMRHAKAERRAESGRDFDRALSERGRQDAAIMGQVLAKAGLSPDVAVVSPAQRTLDTWAAVSAAFPGVRSEGERTLYNAAANTLRDAVDKAGETAGVVLLIAHNPGVHELTVSLLREGGASPSVIARAAERFPTATAAAFTFDAAGRPCYDGLFFVADHGGGGGE